MFANFQFQLIFKRNCTVKTLFIEKCNIYLSRSVLEPLCQRCDDVYYPQLSVGSGGLASRTSSSASSITVDTVDTTRESSPDFRSVTVVFSHIN